MTANRRSPCSLYRLPWQWLGKQSCTLPPVRMQTSSGLSPPGGRSLSTAKTPPGAGIGWKRMCGLAPMNWSMLCRIKSLLWWRRRNSPRQNQGSNRPKLKRPQPRRPFNLRLSRPLSDSTRICGPAPALNSSVWTVSLPATSCRSLANPSMANGICSIETPGCLPPSLLKRLTYRLSLKTAPRI